MNTINSILRVAGIALLTSFSTVLLAQDYRPTAVEGANWVIVDSETPYFPYSTFVRSIEGDTIIDGIAYKKLYQRVIDYLETQFGPPLEPPYVLLPGKDLIALLRDDVEARRVYGRTTNFYLGTPELSADVLFHDYSLEAEDTLVGFYFGPDSSPGPIVIDETGIEERFGEMRRYQRFGSTRFYEGIGSPELGPTSGGYSLFLNCCHWRLVDYCVGEFADCNIISSVVTLPGNVEVSVFPNPFTDFIHLDLPNGTPTSTVYATLRDLTGRVLRTTTLTDNMNWPVADFPAGTYLLTLSDGRSSQTLKMIKQ